MAYLGLMTPREGTKERLNRNPRSVVAENSEPSCPVYGN